MYREIWYPYNMIIFKTQKKGCDQYFIISDCCTRFLQVQDCADR